MHHRSPSLLLAGALLAAATAASAQQPDTLRRAGAQRGFAFERAQFQLLPVDDVFDLLLLRPDAFPLLGRDYNVRGAPRGNDAFTLDGIPLRNHLFGQPLALPALLGLQRVGIVRGPLTVEHANAVSGVVALETRRDSARVTFEARAASEDVLPLWSYGASRLEAVLGAAPLRGLTISGALAAQGNRSTEFTSALRDVPIFVRSGAGEVVRYRPPGSNDVREVIIPAYEQWDEGDLLPFSNHDQYMGSLGLHWQPASGTELNVGVLSARTQARDPLGGSGGAFLHAPTGFTGRLARSTSLSASLRQSLVASDRLRLGAFASVSKASERFQSGGLEAGFEQNNRNPAFGFTTSDFEFVIDRDAFPIDEEWVENFLRNRDSERLRTPYPNARTDLQPAIEYWTNPYGLPGYFYTRGLGGRHVAAAEERTFASAGIDLATAGHDVRAGVELTTLDVRAIDVGYASLSFADGFVEKPARQAVFARDRFRMGHLDVEAGLRVDRFDAKARYPTAPGYFDLDDPDSYFTAEPVTAFSPSVSASWSVDARTRVNLGLIKTARLPDMMDEFSSKNIDYFRYRNTDTSQEFAQPLGFVQSTEVWAGVQRGLGALSGGIELYHQVLNGQPTYSRQRVDDPTNPGSYAFLSVRQSEGKSSTSGAVVHIGSAPTSIVHWQAAYSFVTTKADNFNLLEMQSPDPLGLSPAGDPGFDELPRFNEHQGHSFTATAVAPARAFVPARVLSNTSIGAVLRVASPALRVPLTLITADNEKTNALRELDLRITQRLPLIGDKARLTIDMRNLLNGARGSQRPEVDDQTIELIVRSYRQTLGGGGEDDVVSLASLAAAGFGVRSEVDLAALRAAEARFGNGDQRFTAAEQTAAFGAAVRFREAMRTAGASGRKLRIGFELDF